MKETEKEYKTSKEFLNYKIRNANLLCFFIDRFVEYATYNITFKELLKPYEIKFNDYLIVNDVKLEETSLNDVISYGVPFIATAPGFDVSELVSMGAKLTNQETQAFRKQLDKTLETPSLRNILQPYVAIVGYLIYKHMTKQESFNQYIQDKLKDMVEIMGANIIKVQSETAKTPWEKSLVLLDKLEGFGIKINLDGSVEDPNNLIKHHEQQRTDRERDQSQTGTSGESI